MPVLSCRFQTLQLIVISLSLYASIHYIILNLVPFHYLSLLRTLIISTTDSLSLKAPVATAFIIKYILFFTLSYTFYFYFFSPTCR